MHISRIQLDDALLARLGQGANAPRAPDDAGRISSSTPAATCSRRRTSRFLRSTSWMRSASRYDVMGGPTHCCGIAADARGRPRDLRPRRREHARQAVAQQDRRRLLSWCPSCHVQFTETTLPTVEKTRGAKPFEMTPFTLFVRKNLDRLRPLLREPVPMRIALHKHPGIRGVVEAAEEILRAVPGIELVDLQQPAVGLQSQRPKARCRPIAASCRKPSSRPPKRPASTRWSRSIIPTTASSARTSATGRSAS